MNSKILIAVFACASVMAVAQSAPTSKNGKVSGPREATSGQASGKQAGKGTTAGRESSAPSVSEVVVTKPSDSKANSTTAAGGLGAGISKDQQKGKMMASDDWHATAKSGGAKGNNVVVGDVNGDGRADATASANSGNGNGQSAAINNSHSNIKTARETGSGMATGKRQHAPVRITKEMDASSSKK